MKGNCQILMFFGLPSAMESLLHHLPPARANYSTVCETLLKEDGMTMITIDNGQKGIPYKFQRRHSSCVAKEFLLVTHKYHCTWTQHFGKCTRHCNCCQIAHLSLHQPCTHDVARIHTNAQGLVNSY